MNTLAELNASIDCTLFEPYNLPIYEYILMPQVGSEDFEKFRACYLQSNGKKLEEFKDKLEPIPIYAVFKNKNNNPLFLFEPTNEITPL